MFLNTGGAEVLVIALVALIVVGPEQLPGLIRRIGYYAGQIRSMTDGLRQEFMAGIEEIEEITEAANPTSWIGSGTDDDPVVPRGFADRAGASNDGEAGDESSNGGGAPDPRTRRTKPAWGNPSTRPAGRSAEDATGTGDGATDPVADVQASPADELSDPDDPIDAPAEAEDPR